ncbi:MAG: hypothetical protein O2945_09030 [Planctomycetota bacterium]|nr:hypothetical protein [Planctomycetota bacterium]
MNDPLKRKVHRQTAMTAFLRLKRQEFQAWFGDLMTRCWPDDFLRIRLSQGDGGLDGYRISTRTVFQVFAPRDFTGKEMADKIVGDFQQAAATTSGEGRAMAEWVFVHNEPDDFPHEAAVALAELARNNPDIRFRRWEFTAIWDQVSQLPDEKLDELFGPAPSLQHLENLQYPEIIPVVVWLASAEPPDLPPLDLPDPAKLEYNELSADNADLVRFGRRRSGTVEGYLDEMPDADRPEAIAQAFRDKYRSLRDAGMSVDRVFESLWVFTGGEHFAGKPSGLAAVTAVLSYFFERCDIFENVPDES